MAVRARRVPDRSHHALRSEARDAGAQSRVSGRDHLSVCGLLTGVARLHGGGATWASGLWLHVFTAGPGVAAVAFHVGRSWHRRGFGRQPAAGAAPRSSPRLARRRRWSRYCPFAFAGPPRRPSRPAVTKALAAADSPTSPAAARIAASAAGAGQRARSGGGLREERRLPRRYASRSGSTLPIASPPTPPIAVPSAYDRAGGNRAGSTMRQLS